LTLPAFREDGWLPVGHHSATWEEVVERFGGLPDSRRSLVTAKLISLRDALRARGVTGTMLLNGSYISAKEEPKDFDVLLIGPPNIQAMKDQDPALGLLLDAQHAEQAGYSLFYMADSSPAAAALIDFWDYTKEGVAKGCVKLIL